MDQLPLGGDVRVCRSVMWEYVLTLRLVISTSTTAWRRNRRLNEDRGLGDWISWKYLGLSAFPS